MTKVYFHDQCNDGSGAALAAWLVLGDEAEYIPVQYGDVPPTPLDVADKDVYILDFSFSRMVLLNLAAVASSITIIDHHETAQEVLSDPFPSTFVGKALCPVKTTFDMDKSGAVLAWDYFHPDLELPMLFEYIQDRDLFVHKLKGTNAVKRALEMYTDFRSWRHFLEYGDCERLIHKGEAIEEFLQIKIEQIASLAPKLWSITGDIVPVHTVPKFMASDTLAKALELYPECPYAVSYSHSNKLTKYSLRSRKGSDVSVSEIAKKHGGGGHKHAAGFEVETL